MNLETVNFMAGMMAGASTTLLLHPLDLVKTRLQVRTSGGTSTAKMIQTIRLQESFRGLYTGLSANVTGSAASWAIYFYLYTVFKERQRTSSSSSYYQNLLAAAQAGSVTSLITNPIWLIKTRLCTQQTVDIPRSERKYRGLFHAFKTIVREEGPLALYKGLVPALFGVSHGAIQFMVYEELKSIKTQQYHSSQTDQSTTAGRFAEYVMMAATSKIAATTITYPYQTVKSRLQSHITQYSGLLNVIQATFAQEGLRGFYRGLGTNIIRVMPGTMCTFLVYEATVDYLKRTVYADNPALMSEQVE